MAESIAVLIVCLLIYFCLVSIQKIRTKSRWKELITRGDPWFIFNGVLALVIGIPVAKRVAVFFI